MKKKPVLINVYCDNCESPVIITKIETDEMTRCLTIRTKPCITCKSANMIEQYGSAFAYTNPAMDN